MKVYGIMTTNGGPHPSDKWAEMTANQIADTILVDASPDDTSDAARAARKAKRDLVAKLFDIFDDHHAGVQQSEQGKLKNVKTADKAAAHADHEQTPIDPKPHVDAIMDTVNSAFAATPWAAHLAKGEVQDTVRAIIGQHTVDVMHIERRWHHDRLSAVQGA